MARSSAACRWSTGSCCWSTPPRARSPRPGSCCARRSTPTCRSCSWSTRSTAPDARIEEVVDETYELFMDLLDDSPQPGRPRLPGRLRLRQGRHRCARAARERRAARLQGPRAAVQDDHRHDPGPDLRRGRAAPGPRHQPRRVAVPRPARAGPHPPGHPEEGPERRLDATRRRGQERQDHRAAGHRRASSASRARSPAPATSSPSPASRRSPSVRRSPTRRTRSRCRSSTSTSPPSR